MIAQLKTEFRGRNSSLIYNGEFMVELIKSFSRIPDRGDVTSDLKEGIKFFPADPRWGDGYGKYVEEFREIFFK